MIARMLAGLVLLGLPCAHAAATHGVLVLDEWGVYSANVDHRITDPNATTGHSTMSSDVKLVDRTHVVCAQLGTRFGIRYHLRKDVPAESLTVSVDVVHPPMVNMHGVMQSHDEMIKQVPAHKSWYTGWIFSEPRELLAGVWHIIVRHGGEVDIDESFEVHTACSATIS